MRLGGSGSDEARLVLWLQHRVPIIDVGMSAATLVYPWSHVPFCHPRQPPERIAVRGAALTLQVAPENMQVFWKYIKVFWKTIKVW